MLARRRRRISACKVSAGVGLGRLACVLTLMLRRWRMRVQIDAADSCCSTSVALTHCGTELQGRQMNLTLSSPPSRTPISAYYKRSTMSGCPQDDLVHAACWSRFILRLGEEHKEAAPVLPVDLLSSTIHSATSNCYDSNLVWVLLDTADRE